MNSTNILSGEQFQQLCPIYCGSEYDLHRNPKISSQSYKHIDIEKIQSEWDNPSLIFCYSSSLKRFIDKLPFLKNSFTLVSHNEDTNITDEFKSLVESPLLVRWFAQNNMIIHPKLEFIPIGIANEMWPHGNVSTLLAISQYSSSLTKINNIYFYFSLHTNKLAREQCKSIIESKGLVFGEHLDHINYLILLSTCKFAICPEGNGIDCHRTWECYYLGVIPILLENSFTLQLQKYLPCILLKSWNDFDTNCLEQYDTLYKQLQTSQKYLTLSYYKERILSNINIAYTFIGTLPSYCVDTVHQTRLFHDGPIYFIISDLDSPYVKVLEKYNVTIIHYNDVIDRDFNSILQQTYHKFCIADLLKGREKIFIYSFERFFVLCNLMKQRSLENVFFMELDNLIYDTPLKWLESFSRKDIAFMFDNHGRHASGVCYIKHSNALRHFCDFALNYMLYSNDFMAEMLCLSKYYETNKDFVQLLPIHWEDSTYPIETHGNFQAYNSLFDAAAIGVYLGGADPYHVHVTKMYKEVKGNKSYWSLIDYTKYTYKWELDSCGRNIPYVLDGSRWIRINNLHIHSKELAECLSKPITV